MRFYLLLMGTFFLSGSLHAAGEIDEDNSKIAQSYELLASQLPGIVRKIDPSRSVASVYFLPFSIPFFHKNQKLCYEREDVLTRDLCVPKEEGVQFVRHLVTYLTNRRNHSEGIVQKRWPLAIVYNASEKFYRENIGTLRPGPCDNDHIIQLFERMADTSNDPQDFVLQAVISAKAWDREEPSAAVQPSTLIGAQVQRGQQESEQEVVDNNRTKSDSGLTFKGRCASLGYAMQSHVSDLAFPLIIKYLSNKMDNPVLRRTGYLFASVAGALTARNIYNSYKKELGNLSKLRKGSTSVQRQSLLALSANHKRSGWLRYRYWYQ